MLGGIHFQLLTVNSVKPCCAVGFSESFFDSFSVGSSEGITDASLWSSLITGGRHHRWQGMLQNEDRKASNMFP